MRYTIILIILILSPLNTIYSKTEKVIHQPDDIIKSTIKLLSQKNIEQIKKQNYVKLQDIIDNFNKKFPLLKSDKTLKEKIIKNYHIKRWHLFSIEINRYKIDWNRVKILKIKGNNPSDDNGFQYTVIIQYKNQKFDIIFYLIKISQNVYRIHSIDLSNLWKYSVVTEANHTPFKLASQIFKYLHTNKKDKLFKECLITKHELKEYNQNYYETELSAKYNYIIENFYQQFEKYRKYKINWAKVEIEKILNINELEKFPLKNETNIEIIFNYKNELYLMELDGCYKTKKRGWVIEKIKDLKKYTQKQEKIMSEKKVST